MSWCGRCDGWGCLKCMPEAQRLERLGGEQGLDAEELELVRLRAEVRRLDAIRVECEQQVERLLKDYLETSAQVDALRELLARNAFGPHTNVVETVLEVLAELMRLRAGGKP